MDSSKIKKEEQSNLKFDIQYRVFDTTILSDEVWERLVLKQVFIIYKLTILLQKVKE